MTRGQICIEKYRYYITAVSTVTFRGRERHFDRVKNKASKTEKKGRTHSTNRQERTLGNATRECSKTSREESRGGGSKICLTPRSRGVERNQLSTRSWTREYAYEPPRQGWRSEGTETAQGDWCEPDYPNSQHFQNGCGPKDGDPDSSHYRSPIVCCTTKMSPTPMAEMS